MQRFIYIIILTFVQIHFGFSQVWPGDVNNNGIVNNIDMLYIGNAYGKTGPKRIDANSNWETQEIATEWDDFFPDAINLAYADCNGDGIIDFLDFLTIYTNYNKTHDTPELDVFVSGIRHFDPQLLLNASDSIQVNLGEKLVIPIGLGNDSMQIDNFNGIAFSLFYNPELIKGASIQFNLDSSWINADQNIFSIVQNDATNGVADVTVTRYGTNPVSGGGTIGALSIIIEDDVIALEKNGTIAIDSIRMVDENLNTTAIANDTIHFSIIDTTLSTTYPHIIKQIIINPNPANKFINILSKDISIEKIEIFNLLGERLLVNDFKNVHKKIKVEPFDNGIHIIKLYTKKGVVTKKIMIQH